MEKKFICSECKSVYFYYKNLRKHVRKAHPDKISDIAPVQKSKKTFKFKCNICSKQFNHSYNFSYHQRKVHNLQTSGVFNGRRLEKLKCPLCSDTFPLKKKLFTHIECVHNINIEVKHLQIESFEEFMRWKENLESDTLSKYIKEHGSRRDAGSIKHYFVCHRSGHYNPEGQRQRKLKSQGSQKINGICPASLLVHETDGSVCNIQYIPTHVGHQLDIDHLYLTNNEKKRLAAEINNKIPFQTIIEGARNKSNDSKQTRINRLKKKDLYNIQKKLSLPGSTNMLETVIREINSNDTTSVLFYKLPNTENESYPDLNVSDFILIIVNEWQCETLKKHCSNFICVTKTSDMNFNGFELVTIMTLDNYRQAYPCAFLITNRCDQYVLSLFFNYIKLEIGEMSTLVFMSVAEEFIINAWVTTIGEPKVKHYCTWSVQEEWDKNRTKILNEVKQSEVLSGLKEFMSEHDSDGFEIKLKILTQQLIEDPETTEFGKYFSENFLKNISYWAFCYRYKDITEMNSNLERMHLTLKHLFLTGKTNKNLEMSIQSINDFMLKRLLNDFVTLQDNEVSVLFKEIESSHEASCTLFPDALISEVEDGWKVQSTIDEQEVYYVRLSISDCNCKLVCLKCNTCVHKYMCTCLDSYVDWNMCRHIHLICSYLHTHRNDEPVKLILSEEAFTIPFESEVVISECGEILVQINERECTEINNVIKIKPESRHSNETDKERIKQEFIELIDGITSENELEVVKESMSTLKALLNATQAQTICVNSSKLVENDISKDDTCLQII